jgi:hypothetical protein
MPQATVVVEVLGYRQVAVHIEQNSHIPVWGFTYLGCDGLPAVVNLDEAEVMCFIPV